MVSIIRDLLREIIAALPPRKSLRDVGGLGTPRERGWPRRGWWCEVVMCQAPRNSLKHLISGNEGAQD